MGLEGVSEMAHLILSGDRLEVNMEISARVMAESACLWVKEHPRQFKTIMRLIHEQVDDGNPCVQEGDIAMLARSSGIGWSEIKELKRDHNLWAVLTRYMVMMRPRLARALHFRHSKVDDLDLQRIWWDTVPNQTNFLAENWQEAKKMCEEGLFQ